MCCCCRHCSIMVEVSEVSNDANALLRELREISDRHSKWNCQSKRTSSTRVVEPEEDIPANNAFLSQTDENRNLNQYWYSKNTIETLCHAMRESFLKSKGRKVAFLSTPSLFFSLSPEEQENCVIFDVSLKLVRPVKCWPASSPHYMCSTILRGSPARDTTSMITTIQPTSKTTSFVLLTWPS